MQTAAPTELAPISFLDRFFLILLARLVINYFFSQHKVAAQVGSQRKEGTAATSTEMVPETAASLARASHTALN